MDNNNKLFVGSLSWSTTEEALKKFFEQFGTVVEVKIVTDRATGRSKGFGFVTMSTEEEAKKAMAEANNQELDGRAIKVDKAQPAKPRENRYNKF